MDHDRFEALARSLTTAGSRRRALALALSGALAPLLAREGADAHDKRKKCKNKSGKQKKRCRRKAKKHNARHIACRPACAGKNCGPDGCGGACGTCTGGKTCQGGTCTCPSGTTDCGGECVNPSIDPRHCGGCGRRCTVNEACVGGQCRCGSGGGCGDTGTCCPGGGCRCSSGSDFIDPATCEPVSICPTGSDPCAGPDGFCGPGFTTRTCCPSGTTCTAQGTCLQ